MSFIRSIQKQAGLLVFGVVTAISLFLAVGSNVVTIAAPAAPSNLSASIVDPADRPAEAVDKTNLRQGLVGIINYFLAFLGLLAVAFIIYAGFLMVTGEGEEDSLTKGRKIIIYAIIGIVIIFLSWTIVNWVAGIPDAIQGNGTGG